MTEQMGEGLNVGAEGGRQGEGAAMLGGGVHSHLIVNLTYFL